MTSLRRPHEYSSKLAEEEEKKGEDKGDHINLKVKDQVRAASDVTPADRQKTRAIKNPASSLN